MGEVSVVPVEDEPTRHLLHHLHILHLHDILVSIISPHKEGVLENRPMPVHDPPDCIGALELSFFWAPSQNRRLRRFSTQKLLRLDGRLCFVVKILPLVDLIVKMERLLDEA